MMSIFESLKKKKKSDIFFIRGHPKSGTNWICRLVNLHPDIQATGQFHFENLFAGLQHTLDHRWGLLKRHPAVLHSEFYKMIGSLIIELCGGARMCGDRTPDRILQSTIPGKKCIYISRDGRDVLVSWTFHAFRRKLHGDKLMLEKQELFESNPDHFEKNRKDLLASESYVRQIARKWNAQILEDFSFLTHPDPNLLRVYHIRYEDLHRDTDFHRNEIYKFLGVHPADAAPLADGTKAGFDRIDNESFNRRGASDAWQDYFSDEQLGWFMEEASAGIRLQTQAVSGQAFS